MVNSLIKNVFLIIGTMVVSVALYTVFFGDVGRGLIWGSLEPAFQSNWDTFTMQDGSLIEVQMSQAFDKIVEASSESMP